MVKTTQFPTLFENRGLDDFFEGFFRPVRYEEGEKGDLVPRMDIRETDEAFIIKAEMPGIKKDDIEINIHDGLLTISGESEEKSEEKEEGKIVRQERRYGKYVRSMTVGNNIDQENINASYNDGVLELTLPKLAAVEPKKIKVNVA